MAGRRWRPGRLGGLCGPLIYIYIYISLSLSLSRAWGPVKTPGRKAHPQRKKQIYIYIYIYVCVCVCVCIYIYIYIYIYICISISLSLSLTVSSTDRENATVCSPEDNASCPPSSQKSTKSPQCTCARPKLGGNHRVLRRCGEDPVTTSSTSKSQHISQNLQISAKHVHRKSDTVDVTTMTMQAIENNGVRFILFNFLKKSKFKRERRFRSSLLLI